MNEYISRETVLHFIEYNDKVCHYADERYENVVYATTQKICQVVAEMPAADVQPVKRGRWFHLTDESIVYCSECNSEAYWDTDYGQQLFDYCPYRGAKMTKDGDAK